MIEKGIKVRKLRDIFIGMIIICLVVTLIPVNAFAQEPVIEAGNPEQTDNEIQEEKTEEFQNEESAEEVQSSDKEVELEKTKQPEIVQSEEEITEKTVSQEEQPKLSEEELREQELFEQYGDDPGNGRLTGNIPAGFYDEAARFSTRASYSHNSKFNGYTLQKGIDVSHHQGKIDWAKVKAAGVQFAIIRVGYRGYGKAGNFGNDQRAVENMQGAIAAGIPIGVYIFSQATTEAEAIAEANYALNKIKGYKIDLPVVMDYEYYSSSNGEAGRLKDARLSKRKATNNCLAFCKTVEAAGYDAMVYANKSFLTNQLYANEISKDYEIWLANYVSSTSYTGDYTYWQYSSTGKVNGISGNVDMNFRYIAPDPDPYKLKTSETLNSVSLQWVKPEKEEVIGETEIREVAGYELEKKNSSGVYEVLAEITDTEQLTYTDTGLSQGTAYTYRVRAFYLQEKEGTEDSDVDVTDDISKDAAPIEKVYEEYSKEVIALTGINASTSATGASSTFISTTITWKAVQNVTGYQVQRYDSSKKDYVTIKNVNALSYTDSSVNGNTTYSYRIRPYKTVAGKTVYGPYSAVKSVKTSSSATGFSSSKVNIRKGAGTSKKVLKTVKKGTKLSLTGCSGSWYKVSVKVNGKKKTGYIMKKYVKVVTPLSKTAVTVKSTSFDNVKLTWKKVSGASGYVVQKYNSKRKKYETIKTITKGSTVSYTNSSLNCNTTYKYRVRPYKSYYGTKMYGSYSSAVAAKTKTYITGKVKSKVKVRKGAGTSYKTYKTVKKGTKLTITGSKGKWYRVSIKVKGKKKNAYIMKKYVKL